MSDENTELTTLRQRILFGFQVRRGSHVWAPWGVSGWSAVEVTKPSRKWAKGYRVKPATLDRGSLAKIPLARLIKRDPALKGKDKPGLSPDEVFAHMPAQTEAEDDQADDEEHETENTEQGRHEPAPAGPKTHPEPDPVKRLARLLAMFPPQDLLSGDDW